MASLILVALGVIIDLAGFRVNKNLYSTSFVALNAGLCGFLVMGTYYIIDVRNIQKPFLPFIWQGMVRFCLQIAS